MVGGVRIASVLLFWAVLPCRRALPCHQNTLLPNKGTGRRASPSQNSRGQGLLA